ncbi:MAG: DUF2950 family protein [Planctomycetota bacterium]|jgi:hypothetical protein
MPNDERALRRWRIAYVVGTLVILLLVAAIAIPDLTAPRIASNEDVAIAGLRAYVSAQEEFRKADRYGIGRKVYANPKDGSGFRDLYHIGYDGTTTPEEPVPDLIDRTFAQADVALAERRAKAGYLFVDITGDADGPYDYTYQFGLCAVPRHYGRRAPATFMVDHTGSVWQIDSSTRTSVGCEPKPVTTWPDVEKEGWPPVED